MSRSKGHQPAWQDAVCGGLGAMGASATVHAIDLFKVRLQLQGELDPHALRLPLVDRLRMIWHAEGIRGMYRGLSASMLRQSLYSTTRFGLHGGIKNAIVSRDATLFSYLGVKVAVAMTAGAGGALLSSPADLVMVRWTLPAGAASELSQCIRRAGADCAGRWFRRPVARRHA